MENLKITIRPITLAETPAWEEMRCAMWPDGLDDHAAEIASFFAGTLDEPEAVMIAETEDHRAIALLELSIRLDIPGLEDQPVGYVEGLYIKQEARGQDLGRRLLQVSREWAREHNCIGFASDRAGRIVIDRSFPAYLRRMRNLSWEQLTLGAPDSSMTLKPAERIGKRYQNPVPTSVGGPSMLFKVIVRYLQNKEERTPKRPLGPFHTDVEVYEMPPATGLRVTWFGHSSSLIEIDGVRILIDPVWDERAAPVEWAGPKRFFAPTLQLEQLPRIDAVLLSHDHYDHLGARTVQRLARMNRMKAMEATRWVTTLGVGKRLQRLGVKPALIRELDWTQSAKLGPLELTALPARHFSGRGAFDRNKTLWASFAIAGPQHRVYYLADSGEWPGFAEIGREYGPFDLTMLEIGAFNPLWANIHMGPDGAARTFHALGGSGLLMPIHWGLFDLALHAWRQPIERIFSLDGLRIFSPQPGLPTEVFPEVEVRSEWWR